MNYDHSKYPSFPKIKIENRTWPDKTLDRAPIWCSVDLRDGNQALIDPMDVPTKLKMFKQLVELGFKEIEVGFPSASQTDYDFMRLLIEEDHIPQDVTVQVLVQAREHLVKKTFESLKGIPKAIVHIYNSTSVVQREKVFKLDKAGIRDIAENAARMLNEHATKQPETQWRFEYSPESFTGTEVDYALEVCNAVLDIWKPTVDRKAIINLPATVEMSTPNVFADMVELMNRGLKYRSAVTLSIHTHNDRGTGVAASELGVLAGADRVEGTLLGNGERTGNMDIVNMALNLYTRGVDPKLDFSSINKVAQCVKECTNLPIHPRHPYCGDLVFTSFSGSHQDAIKKCLHEYHDGDKWEIAYLPVDPRDLGRTYQEVIRVNSQSGKSGVAYLLEADHGIKAPRPLQIDFSPIVQVHSENTGKEVSTEEIWDLFNKSYVNLTSPVSIENYSLQKAMKGQHDDELSITLFENNNQSSHSAQGNGPLDIFIDILKGKVDKQIELVDYMEHAIGHGQDANAVAYISLNIDGVMYFGVGIDQDILAASLQAVLSAINNYKKETK